MNRNYIEAVQRVPGAAGSVWLASNAEEYPTLDGDQTADVVVVGGGITGALVARKLSEGGRRYGRHGDVIYGPASKDIEA